MSPQVRTFSLTETYTAKWQHTVRVTLDLDALRADHGEAMPTDPQQLEYWLMDISQEIADSDADTFVGATREDRGTKGGDINENFGWDITELDEAEEVAQPGDHPGPLWFRAEIDFAEPGDDELIVEALTADMGHLLLTTAGYRVKSVEPYADPDDEDTPPCFNCGHNGHMQHIDGLGYKCKGCLGTMTYAEVRRPE